jgi:hypothetical protein
MGAARMVAPSIWTPTLTVACLILLAVHHAEVPSDLLEHVPSQKPANVRSNQLREARQGTRYGSGKVFADFQVFCPAGDPFFNESWMMLLPGQRLDYYSDDACPECDLEQVFAPGDSFGDDTTFGKGCHFQSGTVFGDRVTFGDGCTILKEARIGSQAKIGSEVVLGESSTVRAAQSHAVLFPCARAGIILVLARIANFQGSSSLSRWAHTFGLEPTPSWGRTVFSGPRSPSATAHSSRGGVFSRATTRLARGSRSGRTYGLVRARPLLEATRLGRVMCSAR